MKLLHNGTGGKLKPYCLPEINSAIVRMVTPPRPLLVVFRANSLRFGIGFIPYLFFSKLNPPLPFH